MSLQSHSQSILLPFSVEKDQSQLEMSENDTYPISFWTWSFLHAVTWNKLWKVCYQSPLGGVNRLFGYDKLYMSALTTNKGLLDISRISYIAVQNRIEFIRNSFCLIFIDFIILTLLAKTWIHNYTFYWHLINLFVVAWYHFPFTKFSSLYLTLCDFEHVKFFQPKKENTKKLH